MPRPRATKNFFQSVELRFYVAAMTIVVCENGAYLTNASRYELF